MASDSTDGPSDFTLNMGAWLHGGQISTRQAAVEEALSACGSSFVDSRDAEIEELRADLLAAQEALGTTQTMLGDATRERDAAQQQLYHQKNALKTHKNLLKNTVAKCDTLEGKLVAAQEELKGATAAIKLRDEKIEDITAKAAEVMKTLTLERDEIMLERDTMKNALADAELQLETKNNAENRMESRMETITLQRDETMRERDETMRERDSLKDALAEAELKFETKNSTENIHLNAVKDALSTAEEQLAISKRTECHALTRVSLLEEELENKEASSHILDAKIAERLRKREAYWRGRVEEMEMEINTFQEQKQTLEAERKVMSKELLRQWGRNENGKPEKNGKQTHRYLKRGGGYSS